MQLIVKFFEDVGWLANLSGILGFICASLALFWKFIRPHLKASEINTEIPADFEKKWHENSAKELAKIAIVDDQLADFPTTELKANGYQVQTYRQVSLATTAHLVAYDIVFLDMKGVVKDDPENGGMKLIAELRRLNPVQKICAVSSKTFDINATEFFRQADDAKKKPLTAHECRSVINAFLEELFSVKALRESAHQAMVQLPRRKRIEVLIQLRKFVKNEMTLTQLRESLPRATGDLTLGYRITNIARAIKHVG